MSLTGHSVPCRDALEKVPGRTRYRPDFWMAGMLYCGVLRSPHASARILALRTEKARNLPGVHAVLTCEDVPGRKFSGGPGVLDHPVLAEDRVLYIGQAVALVAAESRILVKEALGLIEVEYELLSAAFHSLDATRSDESQIGQSSNLAAHEWLKCGDVEHGMAQADVIVEQTYHTTWIDHLPLETESGSAWFDEQERLVLRVETQTLEHHAHIAALLALPPEQVRLVCPMVSGFGCKLDMTIELYLALLCRKTRRPVFLSTSREESILAYAKRHLFTMHYKTGVRRDGRLTAFQVEIVADAGPFVYRSSLVCIHSLMLATGPYFVPNVSLDVRAVHTDNVFTRALLAAGGSQINFAYESQMDQLAERLGMDALEFRQINYLRRDQKLPNGHAIQDATWLEESARRAWQALEKTAPVARLAGKKIGRGISANFIGAHAAEVAVDEATGEVTVLKYSCCHDIGQALRPQTIGGQTHGGVAQGPGFSLTEEVAIHDGRIQVPSLHEYLIPTLLDVPDISTIMLASRESLDAFGKRSIGEPPAAASAGAIANAIYDAVGVRITELPITSERVFQALQQRHAPV